MAATMSAIAEPPAVLRIRIPPFEEIEENFYIPYWPTYPANCTTDAKRLIDSAYAKELMQLIEARKSDDDKAEVSCELLTFLYHRTTLLVISPAFRATVRARALDYCTQITNGTLGTAWDGDLYDASRRIIRLIDRL